MWWLCRHVSLYSLLTQVLFQRCAYKRCAPHKTKTERILIEIDDGKEWTNFRNRFSCRVISLLFILRLESSAAKTTRPNIVSRRYMAVLLRRLRRKHLLIQKRWMINRAAVECWKYGMRNQSRNVRVFDFKLRYLPLAYYEWNRKHYDSDAMRLNVCVEVDVRRISVTSNLKVYCGRGVCFVCECVSVKQTFPVWCMNNNVNKYGLAR